MKIIAKKIAFLSLFLVFSLPCHAETDPSFNDQPDNLAKSNADWMGQLDDYKPLSEVTIPGAHDAMAFGCMAFAECQAWHLDYQLLAGIRYFDLRVDNSLRLVHGIIKLHTELVDVLTDIANFLNEHKKETVLIRVKPEKGIHRTSTAYSGTLQLLEERNDISQYVYPLDTTDNNPKLKDVRGKIIFVKLQGKFDSGISYFSTHNKGEHKVDNINEKKETIKAHLEEASVKCKEIVTLTYSSGTHFIPKHVAQKINPWLMETVRAFADKPCLGIIAMDYPGSGLIEAVIQHNGMDLNKNIRTTRL